LTFFIHKQKFIAVYILLYYCIQTSVLVRLYLYQPYIPTYLYIYINYYHYWRELGRRWWWRRWCELQGYFYIPPLCPRQDPLARSVLDAHCCCIHIIIIITWHTTPIRPIHTLNYILRACGPAAAVDPVRVRVCALAMLQILFSLSNPRERPRYYIILVNRQ